VNDLTVIYYTSNQELPRFERRIQKTLLRLIGKLPLISVSQKPMKFGYNICVGDVGVSSQNAYRQLLIGAAHAKTKYICTAEADHLYPREYFRFRPRRENVAYIADPLYVLFAQRGKAKMYALKPRGSESSMIVGRKKLMAAIEKILTGLNEWGSKSAEEFPFLLHHIRHSRFEMSAPAITFKTDKNMHRRTPHDTESRTRYLPYWGTSHGLINKYLK
jgi:hypothetical protein